MGVLKNIDKKRAMNTADKLLGTYLINDARLSV